MKLIYKKLNWKTVRKSISVMLLLGLFSLGAVGDSWNGISVKANGTPIKVMPLGDSITTGKYSGANTSSPGGDFDDIGYREDLYSLLTGAGYSVDFVGTNSNGVFADPDHEGHNGFTDSQIATNIYNNGGENWLNQNPPDVVLLHIGTNSLGTDPSEVVNILNEIDEYESDTSSTVIVIVARIIDWVPNNPNVHKFNDNVESSIAGRPNVYIVDMESQAGLVYNTQPGGDMIDSLHPYEFGYTKMAQCWKLRLDQIFFPGTYNSLPVFNNPIGNQSNGEEEAITPIDMSASDSNGETLTYSALNLPSGLSINPSSGVISGVVGSSASLESPYYVAISVSDGNPCGNSRHLFQWTITELNDPPELVNPGDQENFEGQDPSLQITASDPDGNDLAYSATNLPAGLSINQNGLISGTISHLASGGSPYAVRVTVEDDGNPTLSDYVDFTWTVNDKNGPPIISPISDQDDWEGTTIDPPLEINAVDPDGDNYLLEANNLPLGLSINAFSGDITGTIAFDAVTSGSYKDYLVEIVARDDQNPSNSSNEFFLWRVRNISGPPLVNNPGNQFSQINDEVSLQIDATDPDGDDITYTAEGLPPNLVINPSSGLINGQVAEGAFLNNTFSVTITVTDDSQTPKSTEVDFSWIISKGEIYIPVMIH